VVLKNNFRQGLANASVRGATAGRGVSSNGNFSLVRVDGNRYQNIALRVVKTEPLLESHRGIQSQPAGLPYDLLGIVVSWPIAGADIDPAPSALTGYLATALGVPGETTTHTLEHFTPLANSAHGGDVSRFRTLVGDNLAFDLSGN